MTCWDTQSQVSKLTFWDGFRKAEPNLLTVKVNSVEYTPSLKRQRIWRTDLGFFLCDKIQLSPGNLNFCVDRNQELENCAAFEATLERLLTHSYRGTLQCLWPDDPECYYGSNTNGKALCVVLHEPEGGYRVFRDAYIASFVKPKAKENPKLTHKIEVEFTTDPELTTDIPWLVGEPEVDD